MTPRAPAAPSRRTALKQLAAVTGLTAANSLFFSLAAEAVPAAATAGQPGVADELLPRPTAVLTVDPQRGECLSVVGDTYRILMTNQQTNGAYAAIDMLIPPNGGPGPHAHALFEETFFVMAGEVVVRSETQTYTARKGAFVRIPRGGAIHSFTNESSAVAHLLCVVVPAGLVSLFEEVGQPVRPGTFLPLPPMTPEAQRKRQAAAEKYGQEVFPLDYLKKRNIAPQ